MVVDANKAAVPYGGGSIDTVPLATNGCYTCANEIDKAANAAYSIHVGGFSASSHTCLEFASDAYVLTGVNLMYELTANSTYATRLAISLTLPI